MQPPRKGPLTLDFLRELWAETRRNTLIPGKGVSANRSADGTVVTLDISRVAFRHPWQTTLVGRTVTVRQGFVFGIAATINGIPLAGDAKNPPPALLLPEKFPVEGMAVVCETTLGENPDVVSVRLVPLPYRRVVTRNLVGWPVSFILPGLGGSPQVFPHAFHNLGVRLNDPDNPTRADWYALP